MTHLASDTVGANIRMIRKSRGWSVAELSERVARLGEHISAPVLENIEHGRRRDGARTRDITVDELIVIADALMVSPSLLLPEMISQYETADDDDYDLIMTTILRNLDVVKSYVEGKRAGRMTIPREFR